MTAPMTARLSLRAEIERGPQHIGPKGDFVPDGAVWVRYEGEREFATRIAIYSELRGDTQIRSHVTDRIIAAIAPWLHQAAQSPSQHSQKEDRNG